jgi:hypothetical protein
MNKILNIVKFSFGSFVFLSVIDRFLISFRKLDEVYSMAPSFNPKKSTDYVILWKLDYLNKLKNKKTLQLTFMNHPFDENKQVLRLLGIGDWGLGIGDWAPQSPIPNPQSPIPKKLVKFF